jgi:hypothetical protein
MKCRNQAAAVLNAQRKQRIIVKYYNRKALRWLLRQHCRLKYCIQDFAEKAERTNTPQIPDRLRQMRQGMCLFACMLALLPERR